MDNPLSDTQLNDFVLSQMPHFIAVNYQRLLTAQTPQEKVELAFRTYNLGLRALTLGLVSQYLIRDDDRVSDPYLNELLLQKFPRLTLDAWQQLLFAALRAYEGKRALFFMPELYDFYWDDSTAPSRQRETCSPRLCDSHQRHAGFCRSAGKGTVHVRVRLARCAVRRRTAGSH